MTKKRKINYVINNCREVLKSFDVQGYDGVLFSALFYKGGKKLNPIENASVQYFAQLMRNYDKSENPDKVKVEFHNGENNSLLWSKEFATSDTNVEPVSIPNQFQGFGEAEINDLVQRKLTDYEKLKENEDLKEQIEELTAENEELQGALEEATAQLDAKKQIEYYANLLGMAMPGLAKVLGKSRAGQALGFLSGTDDEPMQIENAKPENDSRNAILGMINEYCGSLDNATLGKLYLVMCEFNTDSSKINTVLELLTDKVSIK